MTTKLCDFCGKEIPENSKICPYCNKALGNEVLTYIGDKKGSLDVSKYTEKSSDEYFKTNIYSFSETEIERRFEKRTESFHEAEVPEEKVEIQYEKFAQTPHKARVKKRKKQKNLLYPVIGVLLAIILIISLIIGLSGGSKDNKQEETTTVAPQTTTTTTVATTTTTATTEPTTTTEPYISPSSVDLDGYLGVDYSGVSDHFGSQTSDPTTDEFYGGNVYHYDGMTITTSSSGKIVSMTIDYTSVKDKDKYRYQNITYYSTYQYVIEELGEPDLNQLDDTTEPCIGYTIDIGSGLSIKFKFDDNKKVSGYDIFYAD